ICQRDFLRLVAVLTSLSGPREKFRRNRKLTCFHELVNRRLGPARLLLQLSYLAPAWRARDSLDTSPSGPNDSAWRRSFRARAPRWTRSAGKRVTSSWSPETPTWTIRASGWRSSVASSRTREIG